MANRVLLGNVRGEAGATGPAGATGQAGANGLTPYIKNGTWWLGTEDTGVTAQGNIWLYGSGNPTTQGNNGDLYLDVLTSDVYKKNNNIWQQIANIKGNTGEQGIQGERGETALTFAVGETITEEAGMPAKVENIGNEKDIILKFSVPRGQDGKDATIIKIRNEVVKELEFESNPQVQINGKLEKFQGQENSGKFLVVDENGYITPKIGEASENQILIIEKKINIDSDAWTQLDNASPYKWQARVNVYFDAEADIIELVNDKPIVFAKYGFAISKIYPTLGGGNPTYMLDIISIDLPNEEIILSIRGHVYGAD